MKKIISRSILSAAAGTLLLAIATVALAQTGATVAASATTSTQMAKLVAAANTALTNRISALTKINARIQAMQKVSAANKASLSTSLQTQITTMTDLKAKIDADTDLAAVKTDNQSITKAYRIYALVIPQGLITASADRVLTITGIMTNVSAKIQMRISALPTGINTASINATLADFNAKVADATLQANAAVSAVVSLTPDNGNTTIAASNKQALLSAKAKLTVASTDLKAARADATTMVSDLKAFEKTSASVNVNANATAPTATNP